MELENIILSKVSQAQRPKVTCSLSYVDYRPKTNAVNIIGHGSPTKRRTFTEETGKGKET
jgi:hypothetical protein